MRRGATSAMWRSELIVVPGVRHIDLYDRVDVIPFDRLAAFFGQHLS